MSPESQPVSGDNTPPPIINMDPSQDAVVGDTYIFNTGVTDASGVKSVTFVIQYPTGSTPSISASQESGSDTWSRTIQGFTDSTQWAGWVVAMDNGAKGGNTATSPSVGFSADTGGGGSSDTVTNAAWSAGGTIQTAAGRLYFYFEIPKTSEWKGGWQGYVCSANG